MVTKYHFQQKFQNSSFSTLKGGYPIIFASNVFHNSHLIRSAGMSQAGGRGGSCHPRFWQIRRRRRAAVAHRITTCPPDFQTLRHACILWGIKTLKHGRMYFNGHIMIIVTIFKLLYVFGHMLNKKNLLFSSMPERKVFRPNDLFLTSWKKNTQQDTTFLVF